MIINSPQTAPVNGANISPKQQPTITDIGQLPIIEQLRNALPAKWDVQNNQIVDVYQVFPPLIPWGTFAWMVYAKDNMTKGFAWSG